MVCDLLAMKARSPVLAEDDDGIPTKPPGLREQDMQWRLKIPRMKKKTKRGESQDRKMLCRGADRGKLGFQWKYVPLVEVVQI
jgi:hypothetical protein